ncbi:protein YgfX [Leucothrix pacifica]|uniref:DUF304 domain-containing protein n=1 Tax=Leucothrix pacifica TaxID=1247513 RepID=A0A317CH29_9GAMM|nr:protein YgfX [Leucothrix pacifica]PWQ97707.1 hypothetical protein DKW60_10060 [Leucothrix pacifica]
MILESPFTAPLRLDIKGSLGVVLLIVMPLLLIAATVVFFTPLAWFWLCLPVCMLGLVAAYYLKLHYWQSLAKSVLEINQDAEKQWAVLAGEKWHLVDLLPTSFVSPLLIVLNFKGPTGSFVVILPADSLDANTHRRLRVRVRMAFA